MNEYALCLVLFGVGVYAVLAKRDIIKIIIGIGVMGYALNLFLLLVGDSAGAAVPIVKEGAERTVMANPLPQAMVLTTVIIGLGMTVLLSGIAIRLIQKYGTTDYTRMRKMKG